MLTETETELVKALEMVSKEIIEESSLDIGELLKYKERFKEGEISDLCNYFIHLNQYQIERNYEDIARWRAWRKGSF